MLTKFTLPPAGADEVPLSKTLWLQSRRSKDGKFLPAGQARAFNIANLCIAAKAVRLIAKRVVAAARDPENFEGVSLLAEHAALLVVQALLPSAS